MKCYLCPNDLTGENISEEHIIPNAIGGYLKSDKLLCRICNSKFGQKADAELAKQFAFLCSYLNIDRDRGSIPTLKGGKTKDGKEYHLVNGSKPAFSKPSIKKIQQEGETLLSVTARNEKELIQILKGLKRKNPDLDIDKLKERFQWKEDYVNEKISFNTAVGGDLAFQAITKIAVNYFLNTKNDRVSISHLIPYLKSEIELEIVDHYYPQSPIYEQNGDEIIHLIHLVGDVKEKTLYCYLELFSSYSFLVLLSDNYTEKDFSHSYVYDVLKNETVEKQVNLSLSLEEIQAIRTADASINRASLVKNLNRVMEIGNKKQVSQEISNIASKSVDEIMMKYQEERITKEMLTEVFEKSVEKYMCFAYRNPQSSSEE
ncbi:MAG: HNH endonuclease [Bacteroidia bacterium]